MVLIWILGATIGVRALFHIEMQNVSFNIYIPITRRDIYSFHLRNAFMRKCSYFFDEA